MHLSGFTSTIPLAYWTIAPGAGQASRHPGSEQCMHWSFLMSQTRPPSVSRSSNLMRFQKSASSSRIVWYEPGLVTDVAERSFHSWQATSQALQPMQVVVSTSFATVGRERIPDSPPRREAEERRISRFCTAIVAPSGLLDLDEEGLEFRRERVRVEDRRRQEVRQRPGVARVPGIAPVD